MIPIYTPYVAKNQKKYVNEALDTNWISSNGPFVKMFEDKFSRFIGTNFATSLSSGTCALEASVKYVFYKTKKRNPVFLIPNFCYIAVANSISNCGGEFQVVDVSAETLSPSYESIKNKIKNIDAIIYVHNYSNISDIKKIRKLCDEHGVILIEDACEALGCSFDKKFLGSFGHIGIFSFFGNKTITTGEGGMISTDSEEIYDYINLVKSHGINPRPGVNQKYNHQCIGSNYRMTNIQAAIGLSQIEDFYLIKYKKNCVLQWYREFLKDGIAENKYVDYNKFENFTNWIVCSYSNNRDKLIDYLFNRDIECRPFFKPINSFEFYSSKVVDGKNSYKISSKGYNLPSYPDLKKNQVQDICLKIKDFK